MRRGRLEAKGTLIVKGRDKVRGNWLIRDGKTRKCRPRSLDILHGEESVERGGR